MTSLSLYSLFYNYLQHCSNSTPISSAIHSVRDILLPTTLSSTADVKKRQKKAKSALYPAYIKEHSEIIDFFATPMKLKQKQRRKNQQANLHPVTCRYRAPRAPIVLCHGLYGFDRMGPEGLPSLQVHYWNGIEKALCDLGAKVIVTRVPKTETISNRAYALHSILSSLMSNKEINFIGHSMGGLDCRYLLSHMKQRSYRVNSLTTICTPHHGSPVADWFRDKIGIGQPHITSTMTNASCMLGDMSAGLMRRSGDDGLTSAATDLSHSQRQATLLAQWFDTPAYSNLTTDYCTQHFNPTTPDDPTVAYYSYTAKSAGSWSNLLDLPGHLVQQMEGDNDGVVSVESGRWGQHVKTVEDADHWDFTGKSMVPYRWKAKTGSDFDRIDFYLELANHLYENGH